MPRDTPPPISKDVLDKWYAKRRARRAANANLEPLGENERVQQKQTPAVESKTVYEAKPVTRDLRKEAVSAFVPTAVRMKLDKAQGDGGLLEPEEADRLEQEGYLNSSNTIQKPNPVSGGDMSRQGPRQVTMEEVEDEDD
jgi:hypothetical protein